MTLLQAMNLNQAAAHAALAVPGVAGLQPGLGYRLANAAARAQRHIGVAARPPEAGIRVERTLQPSGWHVEVRCILNQERRALDTARDVRRQVRSAVTEHLARKGTPEPVTILVTVTGSTP
ncbi:hypothetical protein ACFYXS_31950 [Streptomyces sp. NPDC002574]|uniref:hypothetical protein n=1 Tax=Streptomyces sp. NPDC002574 TaxID=3364652 RepID=UPI003684EF97